MKKLLFLLAVIIISACNTNPPISIDQNDNYGQLAVLSNISSAEIFIDDISSGKFTPDTLTLMAGSHIVRISKDGYSAAQADVVIETKQLKTITLNLTEENIPKIVLIEDFANVSCAPCVLSNKIIHTISEKNNKVAIIKYPASFPSPFDPFYLDAKDYSAPRMDRYNILFVPSVFVDGILSPVSTDSVSIKNAIDERAALVPDFAIEVEDTIKGNELEIEIKVKASAFENINFENLVIHTVVVEEHIEFDTPPGSNGETEFYHVMRKMIPSEDGEDLLMETEELILNRTTNLFANWQKNQIKTIVFIQNKITREVLQAAISK